MILISGCTGFVGQELLRLFKKERISFKKIKTRDIKNKKNIFFKDVSVFIHLGFNFYRKTKKIKSDKNLQIIKKIIKHAQNYKFKLIFPSTASYKYFGKKKKISKNIYPFDHYAQSKINCEKLLIESSKKKNIDTTILRTFNIYGKDQKKGWLIPDLINKFIDKSSKNIELKYYSNSRDFIHVKDVVEAISRSINLKGLNILNIGTSIETKILTVAQIISKEIRSNKKIILLESKSKKNYMSKADIRQTIKKLKWKPKIKINNGLKKIINEKIQKYKN